MAFYETIFIVHPDASDEKVSALNKKFKGILTKNKANIINFEEWGKKKLSYRVKKQEKGYYFLINYDGPPNSISELERIFKVTDELMKFISIKMGKNEVTRLEKKIAARKDAEAQKAAVKEEEPESKETSENELSKDSDKEETI